MSSIAASGKAFESAELFLQNEVSQAKSFYQLFGAEENCDSKCSCCTVPCPVEGVNMLTVGGGAIGTYIYTLVGSTPVVTSASVTITLAQIDMGTDSSTCTSAYARSLDDDGVLDCDAGHILAHRLGG